MLAAPELPGGEQRGADAQRAEARRQYVIDRHYQERRAVCLVRPALRAHDAAHRLDDGVEARPQPQRSLPAERVDRQAHDLRVDGGELVGADAEPVDDANPVVVDHDVRGPDEPVEGVPAGCRGQIEQRAALVPVEDGEAGPAPAAVRDPELVAQRRPLDLDDVGAEIAEQRRGIRTGDDRAQVKHAKPGQRRLRADGQPPRFAPCFGMLCRGMRCLGMPGHRALGPGCLQVLDRGGDGGGRPRGR